MHLRYLVFLADQLALQVVVSHAAMLPYLVLVSKNAHLANQCIGLAYRQQIRMPYRLRNIHIAHHSGMMANT